MNKQEVAKLELHWSRAYIPLEKLYSERNRGFRRGQRDGFMLFWLNFVRGVSLLVRAAQPSRISWTCDRWEVGSGLGGAVFPLLYTLSHYNDRGKGSLSHDVAPGSDTIAEAKGTLPQRWIRVGSFAVILSGILHLAAVVGLILPSTLGVSNLYGPATLLVSGVLLTIGVLELSFGLILLSSTRMDESESVLVIGILGLSSSIILYFASLATPLPLMVPQQTVSLLSTLPLTAKILEGTAILSVAKLLRVLSTSGRQAA